MQVGRAQFSCGFKIDTRRREHQLAQKTSHAPIDSTLKYRNRIGGTLSRTRLPPSRDGKLMTDALDCRRQADGRLYMAQFAMDEQVVKSLLRDIARTWMTLACQIERIDVLRDELAPYWAKRQ